MDELQVLVEASVFDDMVSQVGKDIAKKAIDKVAGAHIRMLEERPIEGHTSRESGACLEGLGGKLCMYIKWKCYSNDPNLVAVTYFEMFEKDNLPDRVLDDINEAKTKNGLVKIGANL